MKYTTAKTAIAVPVGMFEVNGSQTMFYIVPQSVQPFDEKSTEFATDATISAFWWIGTTHIKKEVNMERDTISKRGIDVPIMRNTVDINPYTKLAMVKAKETASELYKDAKLIDGTLPAQKAYKKRRMG